MASRAEVIESVIRPLHAIARPVCDPAADQAGYARGVDQYCEVLAPFNPAELRDGMAKFRDDWTHGLWPVPGKLKLYMIEAQRERRPALPKPPEHRPWRENRVSHQDRQRISQQLANLRKLQSGAFGEPAAMTDAEWYDHVYGETMTPKHRAETLERMAARRMQAQRG